MIYRSYLTLKHFDHILLPDGTKFPKKNDNLMPSAAYMSIFRHRRTKPPKRPCCCTTKPLPDKYQNVLPTVKRNPFRLPGR